MLIQKNGCNDAILRTFEGCYFCEDTGERCVFSWPNAEKCAQKYGLGPLSGEIGKEKKDGE